MSTLTVESKSSSPYESGEIDVHHDADGLNVRWRGEEDWRHLDWHEVMVCADAPHRKLSEELDSMREAAQREGFDLGFEHGSRANMLAAHDRKSKMLVFSKEDSNG